MRKIFYGLIYFGDIKKIKKKIEDIYSPDNYYLIHYNNRESEKNKNKLKEWVKEFNNINVVSIFNIYWSKPTILETQLFLLKEFQKTDYEIAIILDNYTTLVNREKIQSIDDYDLFLNLERSKYCMLDKVSQDRFYQDNVLNFNKGYFPIFNKKNEIKIIKFDKMINNKRKRIKKFLLENKDKQDIEKEKFYNTLYCPFTIGSAYCFTKNQVNKMLDDNYFWDIYNWAKNSYCLEEWVVHNYWLSILKKDKKYKNYVGLCYIYKKPFQMNRLRKMNFKDYLFIRYGSKYKLKRIKKNLNKNKSLIT